MCFVAHYCPRLLVWKGFTLAKCLHLWHQGAAVVHFQDFNAEVLQCLTIPNVNANLSDKSSSLATNTTEVRFFAGDWSEIHQLLPHACDSKKDQTCMTGQSTAGYDFILMAETVYSISSLPTLYELIKKVSCIELLRHIAYWYCCLLEF